MDIEILVVILEGEGSMDFILDSVLLCSVEDEDRFREIIDQMIKKKEVKKFKVRIIKIYIIYSDIQKTIK